MSNRWICLSLGALSMIASTAAAQNSFTVRAQSETQAPVSGALIALVSPANQVIEEKLTSSSGVVTFNAPAGDYLVRVRRIGYRPFYSDQIRLPRNEPLILQVESPRVVLQQMVVSASDQCGRINPDAATLAAVWEEITKGLRASQLTSADLKEVIGRVRYRRTVREDGSVISSDSSLAAIFNRRPFGSPDPSSLAVLGYVRGDVEKGWTFFGPDEVVLLSDDFASTHCFRAVRNRNRPSQVGIAFRPAPKRKQSDIQGVIWVDERTSELREVEFRYVNAGVITDFRPGGFCKFRRMPSGAWIVSEFQLRMPNLTRSPIAGSEYRVLDIVEDGGRVYTAEQIIKESGASTLVGIAFDSLTMTPLRDAMVSVGSRGANTDSRGQFSLENLPAGRQIVTVTHTALEALGLLALERVVELKGDTTRVSLATPSAVAVWSRLCGTSAGAKASTDLGVLHGFVRDNSGAPLANAIVTVRYRPYNPMATTASAAPEHDFKVRTDANGHYAACEFNRMSVGTVVATRETVMSKSVVFEFASSLIQRKDLTIAGALKR